jgi:hypothetical protein
MLPVIIEQLERMNRYRPTISFTCQEWLKKHSNPFVRRVVWLLAMWKSRVLFACFSERRAQVLVGSIICHKAKRAEPLHQCVVGLLVSKNELSEFCWSDRHRWYLPQACLTEQPFS